MATIRCGIVGHPVSHSRSPEIHRAFAAQAGVALEYLLLEAAAEEFEDRVSAFFAGGGHGLNVTLPYKTAALTCAGEVDESARAAGAANVLTQLTDGRIRASNTDGTGFVRDLIANRGFDPAGRGALILGAGGAAAGIAPRLLAAGAAAVAIHNRSGARATALVARLGDRRAMLYSKRLEPVPFDLVVNATSASLHGQEPELPPVVLMSGALAYDLVYADEPSPFLLRMRARGARTADGWGMLVEQAAESFFLWHGIRPDTAPLLRRPRLAGPSNKEASGSN